MSITVKVARIPGQIKSIALADGATVAQALSEAGLTVGSADVLRLNGLSCSTDAVLNDNDRVILASEAKGN